MAGYRNGLDFPGAKRAANLDESPLLQEVMDDEPLQNQWDKIDNAELLALLAAEGSWRKVAHRLGVTPCCIYQLRYRRGLPVRLGYH